jgi:GNAT superfamily N-acetyltransferase
MTAGWRVRRARTDDADALAVVHVDVWRRAYRDLMPDAFLDELGDPARVERRSERWRQDLADGSLSTWVAEVDGSIVGFAGAAPTRDGDLPPGAVELVMINVLEAWAGRGVGRALMGTVEGHWREIGADTAVLWVLTGNGRARQFYARLGWLPDGATGDYELPGAAIPQMRLRKRLG